MVGPRPIEVQTEPRRMFTARAVIVTASTNVLTSGKIKFQPDLPKRHLEAATRLKLGSYDHIALELPGNPLGLRPDELVVREIRKPPHRVDLRQRAGQHGLRGRCRGLVRPRAGRQGRGARWSTSRSTWLSGLYGTDMKSIVKRTAATRWDAGAMGDGRDLGRRCPAASRRARRSSEPLNGRIFLAGEATHETLWGTVGGAWESGERAAEAALRALGRR